MFVLFHYLLWKANLDLTDSSEDLDSWSINVSFSTGSIAFCGVMKTPSCIIHTVCVYGTLKSRNMEVDPSIFHACTHIISIMVVSNTAGPKPEHTTAIPPIQGQ